MSVFLNVSHVSTHPFTPHLCTKDDEVKTRTHPHQLQSVPPLEKKKDFFLKKCKDLENEPISRKKSDHHTNVSTQREACIQVHSPNLSAKKKKIPLGGTLTLCSIFLHFLFFILPDAFLNVLSVCLSPSLHPPTHFF